MKTIEEAVRSRREMLEYAYQECMQEMYKKAQPSLDFKDLLEKIKKGEWNDDEKNPLYKHHYLSHDEAKYIVEKYKTAFRMNEEWTENCDLLIKDVLNGGSIDKYIDAHTDEYGNYHPGYRGYDHVKGIEDQLKDAIGEEAAKKATELIKKRMEQIRDFYRFDREHSQFETSVWLGAMPTTNKDDVISYWKSQGQDIEIVDRDPEKFWYYDEGWTEEEIAEEFAVDEAEKIEDDIFEQDVIENPEENNILENNEEDQ